MYHDEKYRDHSEYNEKPGTLRLTFRVKQGAFAGMLIT